MFLTVNAQGGEYGNALQATSNEEIAELLIEKGADVNAQGGLFGNALQATSEDFTLPHIFQVDSAGVQVLFFWLRAQPNWHA